MSYLAAVIHLDQTKGGFVKIKTRRVAESNRIVLLLASWRMAFGRPRHILNPIENAPSVVGMDTITGYNQSAGPNRRIKVTKSHSTSPAISRRPCHRNRPDAQQLQP